MALQGGGGPGAAIPGDPVAVMDAATEAEARANADATRRVDALTGRLAGMNAVMPDPSVGMHPSPTAVDAAVRRDRGEQVPGFDTPDPYGLGPNATVKPLDPATQAMLNAQLDAFGTGAKESVVEPFVMLKGLTPGISDDLGGHRQDLDDGLDHAVHHPWETAKAAVGWDDLSHGRYAHWAGTFAPGVAVTIVTAGTAGPVAASARAARIARDAEKAATAAKDAEAAAKAAEGLAQRDAFARRHREHRAEMGEEPDHKGTRAALDKAQARTPGPRTSPVDGTQIQDPYNGLTPREYDTKFGPHECRKYPGEHYEGDPDKDGFMGGKTEPASLPLGAVFDRLGEGTGQCVSLRGTPWEQRALPPESLNRAYRRYEVVKPLPDWALAGKAAKAFGQPGGSTQFHTKGHNVDDLIAGGYLVEVS